MAHNKPIAQDIKGTNILILWNAGSYKSTAPTGQVFPYPASQESLEWSMNSERKEENLLAYR